MHIHILGICGTFMGGLALLARQAGYRVSGCDKAVYPPMSDQLARQGIALIEGYDADQLSLAPDLYLIGNVITRGNPLMEAILDQQLPYISGPQWLGDLLQNQKKWVLAIAGTHGKTTTASILAWLLDVAGLNPSFLIGGVPLNFGVSARLTPSNFFVIEADEYDTAFFDKRSKFVHYRPRTAVLNNLEYDHADIFADLAAIETQFHHLVRIVPTSGRIILNGRDPALARVLARGCWSEVERFDVDDGWQMHAGSGSAVASPLKSRAEYRVYWQRQRVACFHGSLLEEHNQSNALAAIAAARHSGVSPAQSCEALTSFLGVKRRMERRGKEGGVTVYDDFAHHPTAISATIAGLRAKIDENERIFAIIELRSNTMKLGVMAEALLMSLEAADLIFAYAEQTGRHALSWDLNHAFEKGPRSAHAFAHLNDLLDAVICAVRPGDHLLVMSNGAFGGIHQKLLDGLAQRCMS